MSLHRTPLLKSRTNAIGKRTMAEAAKSAGYRAVYEPHMLAVPPAAADKIQALEKQVQELQSELDVLERKLVDQDHFIQGGKDYEEELKSWRQSAEAELVRHQEDRLQAEAELAQLRLALDNEQQARTALEQEIEQTQQDMGAEATELRDRELKLQAHLKVSQEAVNSLRKQLAEVQVAATEGELRFGEATAALSAAQSNVHRLEAKLKLVSGQKQANVAELEQALAEAQAAADEKAREAAASHSRDIKAKARQVSQLQQQLQLRSQELAEANVELNQAEGKATSLQEAAHASTASHEQLLHELQARASHAEAELAKGNAELSTLQQGKADAEQRYADAFKQLSQVNTLLADRSSEHAAAAAAWQQEKVEGLAQIQKLKDETSSLKAEVHDVRNELQTEQHNFLDVNMQISTLQQEHAAEGSQRASLLSEVDDLKQQNHDLRADTRRLQAEREHFKKEGDAVRAELVQLVSDDAALKVERNSLRGARDKLKLDNQRQDWELSRLRPAPGTPVEKPKALSPAAAADSPSQTPQPQAPAQSGSFWRILGSAFGRGSTSQASAPPSPPAPPALSLQQSPQEEEEYYEPEAAAPAPAPAAAKGPRAAKSTARASKAQQPKPQQQGKPRKRKATTSAVATSGDNTPLDVPVEELGQKQKRSPKRSRLGNPALARVEGDQAADTAETVIPATLPPLPASTSNTPHAETPQPPAAHTEPVTNEGINAGRDPAGAAVHNTPTGPAPPSIHDGPKLVFSSAKPQPQPQHVPAAPHNHPVITLAKAIPAGVTPEEAAEQQQAGGEASAEPAAGSRPRSKSSRGAKSGRTSRSKGKSPEEARPKPPSGHSASKPPPKRRGRPPKVRPPPEPEVPPPSEDQDAVPEQAAEGEFSAAAGQDVPEADAEAAAAAPSQAEVPVTVPIAAKGPRGGGRPKDIPSGGLVPRRASSRKRPEKSTQSLPVPAKPESSVSQVRRKALARVAEGGVKKPKVAARSAAKTPAKATMNSAAARGRLQRAVSGSTIGSRVRHEHELAAAEAEAEEESAAEQPPAHDEEMLIDL